MNGLLTINEVCKRLKVSRVTIYDWMNSGRLKAIKFGKGVRIREEDVAAFGREWRSRKKKPAFRKTKKSDTTKTKSSPPLLDINGWASLLEGAKDIHDNFEKSATRILKIGDLLKERGISDGEIEKALSPLRSALMRNRKTFGQLERIITEVEKRKKRTG